MKVSLLLFLAISAASCFASTTECQSTYQVSGVINFCVTANGNIANFYSVVLQGAEGYGICAPGGPYYDLGLYGDSGNWAPATITQPKGPDTFPITITRYTADGVFRVIQSFSFAGAGSSVLVKMDVMTFGVFNPPITFFRYADPPTFPADAIQYGATTAKTAVVLNQGNYGLTARSSKGQSAALIVGGPPNVCNWQTPDTMPYTGDAATLLQWKWGGGRLNLSFNYSPLR